MQLLYVVAEREAGSPIRLVGGSSPAEGLVTIQRDGVWGYICDLFWYNENSQVVCNQLGFFGNASTSYYGEFRGGIEIDSRSVYT